jgi:hypothetical protein
VIDGYKRIAAPQQLARDTVDAVVWPMSGGDALLLDRSRRLSEQETALEQGLLAGLEHRFGYGTEELARRFDRSVGWGSRRLAWVELLPETIQQQVRDGKIGAHSAMKFLVPAARINLEDCERMAAIFAQHHCESRQAGQLYAAWRDASPATRKRILDAPDLFFKTQRQADPKPQATHVRSGVVARSGDGGGDCEPRSPPTGRRGGDRDGCCATPSGAAADRAGMPSTGSFVRPNGKGARSEC